MTPKLNVIIGSTRPGRVGPSVAKWVRDLAVETRQFDVELVDLAEFNLPLLDEPAHPATQRYVNNATKRWSASVDSADAYIFATPEYDYFPPAALVNAVQVVMREWGYKPAGVVSYGGVSGGLRSSQVLRQLLGNVNVHALPQVIPVHFVSQYVSEDGEFLPEKQIVEGASGMLHELHKWTTALQTLRPAKAQKSTAQAA
jgi:NAD(P)H-dependent FMN reductase